MPYISGDPGFLLLREDSMKTYGEEFLILVSEGEKREKTIMFYCRSYVKKEIQYESNYLKKEFMIL